MENLFVLNAIATPATLLALLNLQLKSMAILGVFLLLDRLLKKRVDNKTQHLLWLNALFCLSLLPALPTLIDHAAPRLATTDAWFEITVTPASTAMVSSTFNYAWLLMLYFIPTLWLFSRMAVALVHLSRIQQHSKPVTDRRTLSLLENFRAQLNIKRPVMLTRSPYINSPMSFGLITPRIILPAQSDHWSVSVLTDVLLHELIHIKRLDWITMMLAWFVAALYWINPLVWFAVKRLNDEAENSCDSAVLLAGRSDTDYAESLLSVAQACIHSAQPMRAMRLPVQKMLDRSTLTIRIHRILEDNAMNISDNQTNNYLKKSVALMLLVSAAVLFGIGDGHLVSAQTPASTLVTEEDEMIPLHHIEPVYPVRAARRGVEGWIKLSFTVTAAGSVDAESIDVIDAEPSGMFDTSARRAISEFTFTPRIRNGVAVDVPNVQYMFRYSVSEDSVQQTTH